MGPRCAEDPVARAPVADRAKMARLIISLTDGRLLQTRLKQGINSLGRSPSADIPIPDVTISLNHCELELAEDQIRIRDLDSTNGTYIDGRPIKESTLFAGQVLQLGSVKVDVDLRSADPEQSGFIKVGPPQENLSLQQGSWRQQARAHAEASTMALPMIRPRSAPAAATAAPVLADAHCRFHARVQARHHCPACSHYFCDLCVDIRNDAGDSSAFCRECGGACSPLGSPRKQRARTAARGFFGQAPEAFAYPFRGSGLFILLGVTLFLSLLQMIQIGLIGLLLGLVALGYMFSFMQGIINTTAVGDNEMPDAPGLEDVFSGCFQLAGTLLASFAPALILDVARHMEQPVPDWAISLAYIAGCLYFPMAFLVVAIKDTLLAAIPTEVLPPILRTWRTYFPMTLLVLIVYFSGEIGGEITTTLTEGSFAGSGFGRILVMLGLTVFWHFITLYLLTVNTRVLGLFYRTHKAQLGWSRK